jgi:hypothetical protein
MAGNAGKGREPGSRNKRTQALMELAQEGESPCAFAMRIMRDENQPSGMRLGAAKIAAPYVHSKPQPEPRHVTFNLPEQLNGSKSILAVHENLIRATASGELALDEAKEISAMLENHRKLVETTDLEARIARLEQQKRP